MTRGRTRLAVGLSPPGRIKVALVAVPFLATTVVLVVAAVGVLAKALSRPTEVAASVGPGLAVAALFLVGAFVTGGVVYGTAVLMRHAVWLDGTRLGVRRLVRTRWVDLASAEIVVDEVGGFARAPRLQRVRAGDPGSGVRVDVPVDSAGSMPAGQVLMLADALTHGRVRAGDGDPAFLVADGLRARAQGRSTME